MKYTSKPVDFEKLKNEGKFSDRVKKYIAQVLLAAQVLGAVPALGGEPKVVEFDLHKYLTQEKDINNSKGRNQSEMLDRAVQNFGSRNEINRDNYEEFSNINKRRDNLFDEVLIRDFEKGKISYKNIDNYFTYSKEDILKMQKNGIRAFMLHSEDPQSFTKIYTASDLIEIQEFYEKHFSEIRDNHELSEKEKIIAATMVLKSLITYDYQAAEYGSRYASLATFTSRDQYSFMKYGTGICVAYADSMKIIGDMFRCRY